MIEPGFDASTDFDVAVGDDDSDDGDVDAGKMPPVKDAAPPKKDAVAPPMDAGGIIPLDSGGIIPMEDAGGGGGEPECDPIRCATGCCYGNICAQGMQNIACGSNGFACSDCTAFGEICAKGTCVSPFR